jgi:hypothetical protein
MNSPKKPILTFSLPNAFCLYQILAGRFRGVVREFRVVERSVSGFMFVSVDVAREIFGYIAVKQYAEDILLEVPAVYAAAQIVGDIPNRAVKFRAFKLFSAVRHYQFVLRDFLRFRFGQAKPAPIKVPFLSGKIYTLCAYFMKDYNIFCLMRRVFDS